MTRVLSHDPCPKSPRLFASPTFGSGSCSSDLRETMPRRSAGSIRASAGRRPASFRLSRGAIMTCRRSAAGMRGAGGRARRRSGGAGGRDRADRRPEAKPAPGGSMRRKRRRAHETALPDGRRRRDRHLCRLRDVRPERAARRRIRPARPTPAPPARRDAAARARYGGRARSGRPPARRGRRARAARRRRAGALLHVCRPPNNPSCRCPRSGKSSVTRIGAKRKENIPLDAADPPSPLRNRSVDDARRPRDCSGMGSGSPSGRPE